MTTPTPPRIGPSTTTPTRTGSTPWTRFGVRRARVVSANPVRTEPVIGTADQIARLVNNPHVVIVSYPVRLADGRWKVVVTWTDRAVDVRQSRYIVTGGRRAALTATVTVGTLVLTYTAARVVWWLCADQIVAGLKAALTGGVAVVLIAALCGWWLRHGRNGCPGLHCPGCGK